MSPLENFDKGKKRKKKDIDDYYIPEEETKDLFVEMQNRHNNYHKSGDNFLYKPRKDSMDIEDWD